MNMKQAKATTEAVNIYKRVLVDEKVNIKFKLAGLWTTLMTLFIYADIYSLYRPGYIDHMRSGFVGPFQVTQNILLIFQILMMIPALMIFLSLTFNSKVNRIANIFWGAIYAFVCIGNLIGETWIYYLVSGTTELFICLIIIYQAIKWPKQDTAN